MTLYQRGSVWWYEFVFRGQRIRESSNSKSKSIAERIQRERRRQLELGIAGLKETRLPQMFSVIARKWHESSKAHWSANNARIELANFLQRNRHHGKWTSAERPPGDRCGTRR